MGSGVGEGDKGSSWLRGRSLRLGWRHGSADGWWGRSHTQVDVRCALTLTPKWLGCRFDVPCLLCNKTISNVSL